MFAVIETGGKQYRVTDNDVILVEKIDGSAGDIISLSKVLMLGAKVGVPYLEGAVVSAEILAQTKGDKVRIFKKKRRHNYRRGTGHRQQLTALRITSVEGKGGAAKPAKKAAAPKVEETKVEAKKESKAAPKAASAAKKPAEKAAAKPKAKK